MLATTKSNHATLFRQVHMRQGALVKCRKVGAANWETSLRLRKKNLNLMRSVGLVMRKRYEDYVWKEISKLCQKNQEKKKLN